jgi:hypothetical protein
MEPITHQEGNDLIKQFLSENRTFAVSRVGSVELYVVEEMRNGRTPDPQQVEALARQAGYYGNCLEEYSAEYTAGVACADIQIIWKGISTSFDKGKSFDQLQKDIFECYSKESIKVGHRAVEPYFFDNPWSMELKGKKVLVISPISQTVRYQWKRIDKIWGEKKMCPEMDLQVYQSVQSIGGIGPHGSWFESLNVMKDDISKIEFDVALVSCGAYGLPIVNHVKNELHKTAIYVGGALQLFFGIKGRRWDNHDEISLLFNEHWRRPFDIEIPENSSMVEGGCYW